MSTQVTVCGFAFTPETDRRLASVLLCLKARPDWQRGRNNGVGGKVEAGETRLAAMAREFEEETGHRTRPHDWTPFAIIRNERGVVHFYSAVLPRFDPRADTDEPCMWFPTRSLPENVLHNLRWLIPLAADRDRDGIVLVDYKNAVPPAPAELPQ